VEIKFPISHRDREAGWPAFCRESRTAPPHHQPSRDAVPLGVTARRDRGTRSSCWKEWGEYPGYSRRLRRPWRAARPGRLARPRPQRQDSRLADIFPWDPIVAGQQAMVTWSQGPRVCRTRLLRIFFSGESWSSFPDGLTTLQLKIKIVGVARNHVSAQGRVRVVFAGYDFWRRWCPHGGKIIFSIRRLRGLDRGSE